MKTHVSNEAQLKMLRRKCAKHGLGFAKKFARSWVENGQPGFFSSRELCNFLSSAVEKRRKWMYPITYLQSKHGSDIYWHMWSGPPVPPIQRVQPAATEPAEQAGHGPLGCDGLLGADHQPEGKP